MTAGTIVRSAAGHDKGSVFMVLAVEEPYVLLADGRSRMIEKPKRKKAKHAVRVGFEGSAVSAELTNRQLRGILRRFASSAQPGERGGYSPPPNKEG
ncbi:MAG: KOW domain-containing RNA-binding protein [Oscillospiraceae bacterium]|nr:KOW domain-containing RNA-binding protein [Oscillospiraceae bacterium]